MAKFPEVRITVIKTTSISSVGIEAYADIQVGLLPVHKNLAVSLNKNTVPSEGGEPKRVWKITSPGTLSPEVQEALVSAILAFTRENFTQN